MLGNLIDIEGREEKKKKEKDLIEYGKEKESMRMKI